MQQRDPGQESNRGSLQSLGTWVARATNRAKRRPNQSSFLSFSSIDVLLQQIDKTSELPDIIPAVISNYSVFSAFEI